MRMSARGPAGNEPETGLCALRTRRGARRGIQCLGHAEAGPRRGWVLVAEGMGGCLSGPPSRFIRGSRVDRLPRRRFLASRRALVGGFLL